MDSADKAAWRRRVREWVRALPPQTRVTAARQLREVLLSQSVWAQAKSVLCFAPMADEPNVWPIIEDALHAKRAVALPRYDKLRSTYEAARITARITARSQCVRGAFGALEPSADCPAVSLNQLDLILVPAVAFDFAGRRLGRGKGFYDRLLAEVRGHKCGVCFDEQIVTELPEEPHDVRVNSIVTPTRWQVCGVEG
jgi:5-formyltetrahydrofolate cyclo-ligase